MNFSNEQKEIIEAPVTEKTIVMASAASGKTATLTERIRFLLKNGIEPNKLVALTFTNNAAAEMKDRLGDDFKDGMFMGTIHSYANMLLTANGHDTHQIREEDEFDELFELIAQYPEVIRPVDYLLCDESQDLNSEQFEFINTIIDPRACLIVGDVRQSIYGFRGAEPKMMLRLMRDEDYVVRNLTQNYRNAKKIINFSNSILNKMKDVRLSLVRPMKTNDGIVAKITSTEIVKLIKKNNDYGKWAILSRSNAGVSNLMNVLKRNNIPCLTFRQAQGSLDDLRSKMAENAVKVLTIHSSKGLEFDKVIVCDMYTHGEENLRVDYVAVTRAREELYICTK